MSIQEEIIALHKRQKTIRPLAYHFAKTLEEVGEAYEAILKHELDYCTGNVNPEPLLEHIGEELADVAIQLFILAEMYGRDLIEDIRKKRKVLAKRWAASGRIDPLTVTRAIEPSVDHASNY